MEFASKRPRLMNNYTGYTLPAPNTPVERLISTPDPKKFYETYVKPRRPVVIETNVNTTKEQRREPTKSWYEGLQRWSSNDYLKQVAGSATVRVETRTNAAAAYGQGTYVQMTFESFLNEIERGSTSHYLTTQDIDVDEEGRPAIMSSPCTELAGDFPLVPPLAGNLIPMNVNIWMGNSPVSSTTITTTTTTTTTAGASSGTTTTTTTTTNAGASSGLHHDFHDNVYCLLRGRKRFRLFSPADAPKLYTYGSVAHVHPNGRINYEGELTHADGSTEEARDALAASREMDDATEELEAAEDSVERQEEGSAERLAMAEERMEHAMDVSMEVEMKGFIQEEEEEEGEEGEDDDEIETWNGLAMSDGKEAAVVVVVGGSEEEDEESEQKENVLASPEPTPPHFSKIDMSMTASERLNQWPLAAGCHMTEVVLNAGDMLFLPAGWFHEVLSETTEENNGHMAFNYWFHPPDGATFEKPYASEFWLDQSK